MAPHALNDHQARMAEIGAWSTMNANLQNHLLAAKAAGLDPERSVIPWGATHNVTHINQESSGGNWATKLALTGVAGLGVSAGGLGLASLAGLLGCPEPPAQTSTPAAQYEWILDVERTHEFSGRIDTDLPHSGRSRSDSSTRNNARANP